MQLAMRAPAPRVTFCQTPSSARGWSLRKKEKRKPGWQLAVSLTYKNEGR